jgi:hypothetical protein
MKQMLLIAIIVLALNIFVVKSVMIENENVDIRNEILDSYLEQPPKELFKAYHFLYQKPYDLNTEEALQRYRAFKENLKEIKNVNSQNLPYKFGIGPFSDMTDEEFKEKVLMKPTIAPLNSDDKFLESPLAQSKYVNWSSLLRPALQQGSCGGCYTFSATTAIEANYKIAFGTDIAFSQQYIIDCDKNQNGCNGGDAQRSFTYIQNNGIPFLNNYPYVGLQSTCRTGISLVKPVQFYEACSGFKISCSFSSWNAILAKGPVVSQMDAASIKNYKSGIT